MGAIKLRSIVTNNLLAALIYFLGAITSSLICLNESYFIPVWIPLGLSAGFIFFRGISILPGIFVASFISHIYLSYRTISLMSISYFPFATVLLIVIIEIGTLYLFNWYKEKRNWTKYMVYRDLEVKYYFLISILLPFPLLVIYGWFIYQIQALDIFSIEISMLIYFSLFSSVLIFTTLLFAWLTAKSRKYFSNRFDLFRYLILITLLAIVVFNHFMPLFGAISKSLLYIISIPIFVYISIKYPARIYSATIAIFFLVLMALPTFLSLPDTGKNTYFVEIMVFMVISSITSLYIKEQTRSMVKAKEELKSNYQNIEDEIARQVNEYKNLNDSLFIEIEKRGIAERELDKSRKLLTEAQEVSKISTWEYSKVENKFKWIFRNEQTSFIDLDLEVSSLKSLAERIHPDDLAQIIIIKNDILKRDGDFELEIRILNKSSNYNYYLVRGRSYTDNVKNSRVLGLLMDITERKLSELELEENEHKYRALFKSNIDPICVIDAKTLEIQDVNPAFESIYGYKRNEIVGQQYTTLSAQVEETKTAITIANQKGYYRVSHRIHRRKNGDEFYLEGSLMSYIVKDKRMLFIISHDITQRKETELRLAEREQKFRSFFESDMVGMAEISIAKQWISFNEKFTRILGYTPAELKLKTLDDISNIDDILVENQLFKKVLTHEAEGYTIEKRFIAKNSSQVYCKVVVKAIKTPKSTISHLIMMVDDISDRKRAETELRDSKAQLSHSQSVAKLGSIRFHPGLTQVVLSDEAYEILGFGQKRPVLSRKEFFKTILPGPHTRFEQIICDLENGVHFEGSHEQAFLTPKSEIRYVLINFGTTHNKYKQVTEVLATLADITRIKQAEMALKETNTLKDQLLSIIGHDLRSPIGSMKQLIEIYIKDRSTLDDETASSILESLHHTSDETYNLLESLLEWAKSQRMDSYKPIQSDLVTIVEQVLSLSKSIADGKGIILQKNLVKSAPAIVDIEMIKTVLRNLISNSIKFTPHSGMIKVEITQVDELYEVTISDTGKGIPKDILSNLFDNKSTYTTLGTNNEKGTGLGLKLVKKFVERNGGTISAKSEVGQGSSFCFTVPKLIEQD
jgi:PAS domain S-box-containing protein